MEEERPIASVEEALTEGLPENGAPSSTPDSIVDRLKKHAAEVQRPDRTKDIDIPGYDGELFARYGLLDSHRFNGIAERIRKTIKEKDQRPLAAAIATLTAACQGLYARDPDGTEVGLHELPGRERETPIVYELELAEILGFEGAVKENPTARNVVLQLFGGNDIAIAAHNAQLSRWMISNESEGAEEFFEDFL